MIRSFGSKDTERIWHDQYVKRVDWTVHGAVKRKLERCSLRDAISAIAPLKVA